MSSCNVLPGASGSCDGESSCCSVLQLHLQNRWGHIRQDTVSSPLMEIWALQLQILDRTDVLIYSERIFSHSWGEGTDVTTRRCTNVNPDVKDTWSQQCHGKQKRPSNLCFISKMNWRPKHVPTNVEFGSPSTAAPVTIRTVSLRHVSACRSVQFFLADTDQVWKKL